MHGKSKSTPVPSDAQAREKLALYVYEYLLHVGAQKAAQTFLTEIRWEKNIALGESPGFLHSWWCVFWDLYCAAPERRDQCEHSSEGKAFHDYGFVNSGGNGIPHNAGPAQSPIGQIPPNEGMPGGPMPPTIFPNATMRPSPPAHPPSQQSPHTMTQHNQMIPGQSFMGAPRYPTGPRGPGVRMPQGIGGDFNGPPGQPMMPNNMDPSRHGPGGIGPMNPRMNSARGPGMGPMGPGSFGMGMRGPPPNGSIGPGGPGMMPMGMAGGRPQWHPNTSTPMNYSPSPGSYGGPLGSGGPPGPRTPIMPSPQDSSNPGGDNMYTLMKPTQGGNMGGEFPMSGGSDCGPMGPHGSNPMGPDDLDGMKNSPASRGLGTPHEDSGSGDYNLSGFGVPATDHIAILKIKESMQEEAKRFEKDSDQPDYFMQ